jgi:ABC-type taurine transport system ATPase subunit
MLFLDEVINVLDDAGREKLIETLLKEVNLNTFLVSHGYTHPLLAKVNVVKEKDTSRLD